MLVLEHGKPMIFGKDRDKGIRLNGLHPEVVDARRGRRHRGGPARPRRGGRGSVPRLMLSRMCWPEFPVPVGRPAAHRAADARPLIDGQIAAAIAKSGAGDLGKVLLAGETWTVDVTTRCDAGEAWTARQAGTDAAEEDAICPGLPVRELPGRRHLRELRRRPAGHRHPAARHEFRGELLGMHLDELGARPPRTVDAGHARRRGHRSGCTPRARLPARRATASGWSASSPTATRS